MNLEGIQKASITALKNAKDATVKTAIWLGKNVQVLAGKAQGYAVLAANVFMRFLKSTVSYSKIVFEYSKDHALKAFYASKTFILNHKSEALFIGLGAASAGLVFGAIKLATAEN